MTICTFTLLTNSTKHVQGRNNRACLYRMFTNDITVEGIYFKKKILCTRLFGTKIIKEVLLCNLYN